MVRCALLAGEVGFPKLEDEAFGRIDSAVEKKRADQRFDDVADDILALAGAVLAGLLAEADEGGNADLAADVGAGVAVDQRMVAAREIAFGFGRIALVERGRDDHAEHAVAEEFEPLVAVAADARVGEGELEQRRIARLVAELFLDEMGDLGAHSASPYSRCRCGFREAR